jgi:GNAT superfamily N-acetyltransferase
MTIASPPAGTRPAALPHPGAAEPLRIIDLPVFRQGKTPALQPAVSARRGDEIVGYMTGLPVEGLRGSGTSVFVPEWAHGTSGPNRTATFEALYAAISARWAAAGWRGHFVSILPGDPELERTLVWLGFGLCVIDAVRELGGEICATGDAPVRPAVAGSTIERATPADADALATLIAAHDACYAAAPTFLYRRPIETADEQARRWLGTPGESVWVARSGSRLVSFMYLRPPSEDAPRVVRKSGTLSIGGAFTAPEVRGIGYGTTLIDRIATWARSEGYERLAVDFETANLPARRFWLRSFEPVCLTFERHPDDRLAVEPAAGR